MPTEESTLSSVNHPRKSLEDRIKDNAIWIGGMLGIYYETVIAPVVNEALLITFGTMIGIQALLAGVGSGKEIEQLKAERDKALELLAQQNELIEEYRHLINEREKWSHLS